MFFKNLFGIFGKFYLSNGFLFYMNIILVGYVIIDVKILVLIVVVFILDGE